jgi:flap endonuclease-1
MGSSGIGRLVKEGAVLAMKEKRYTDYTGKKLVIDLMMWLYRFKIAMISQPSIKSINLCLWSKINNMLEIGILPIFVMDGKPPKLKRNILDKRRKSRELAKSKLKDLSDEDSETKIKLMKRSIKLTNIEINSALSFLHHLGFEPVQSLEEADPQCAGITKTGKAYGVVSEDWDTLIFGATKMITNFSKKKKVIEYDGELVLKSLGFNKEQFVEMAIILGCDYCDGVSVQGCEKSKEVMHLFGKYKQYGSLEKLLIGLPKENKTGNQYYYRIPSDMHNMWKEIKSQFIEVEIYNPESMNFNWHVPDYSSLRQDFCEMNNRQHTNTNVNKIREYYKYYSSYGCLVNSREYKENLIIEHMIEPVLCA